MELDPNLVYIYKDLHSVKHFITKFSFPFVGSVFQIVTFAAETHQGAKIFQAHMPSVEK